ncbi:MULTISPECIES: ParB N-terminal domain-containing protein [unclassified Streptomyces]|uniref:ParB N-terminal domain-containing protein n=1 Tax=unclassified Streptomyces TaxID=2593676 RepID=UPI00088859D4|nr:MULTISPECIES: ParB N-terminal domain-containing protein [unclassified Streptomyces]PBC83998.1 ParB-like nuclease family protein [Streptomyces sp. 2321.6]SDR36227.1 ParB-like nuclease domain-containing protein [Streptomyces sp. KS_16]SED16334.1 ParB-like nuclease domain-containing protein [Streptomyces sp. 2133.1]SNC70078.1 ParB-like nuclease domain-containing protein [Streptomyces sp. 2114.4]
MEHTLKIHPAADIFPMLSQDELLDLAESIKAEGQHHPIVLDADGAVLDGRNRLAACKLAGVDPRFTTHTGNDPLAEVLSGNLRRRHIGKGQQAMITIMACSLSGHSLREQAKLHGLSRSRLSAANVVLKHSRRLAEQVRTGETGLDTAYRTALEDKARTAALQEKYDRLREYAPELAEQVTEGLLAIDDAISTLDERQEEGRLQHHVRDADAIRLADGDTAPSLAQLVEQGDITWRQAHQRAEEFLAQRQDAIHRARQALQLIAETWATVQDLAARLDTPYGRDILDGLTPEARSLAQSLTTLV